MTARIARAWTKNAAPDLYGVSDPLLAFCSDVGAAIRGLAETDIEASIDRFGRPVGFRSACASAASGAGIGPVSVQMNLVPDERADKGCSIFWLGTRSPRYKKHPLRAVHPRGLTAQYFGQLDFGSLNRQAEPSPAANVGDKCSR